MRYIEELIAGRYRLRAGSHVPRNYYPFISGVYANRSAIK